MAEWISVNEKLPKPYIPVLVCRRMFGDGKQGFTIECINRLFGGDLVWNGDLKTFKSEVTHWMPLPEPPKEGE